MIHEDDGDFEWAREERLAWLGLIHRAAGILDRELLRYNSYRKGFYA